MNAPAAEAEGLHLDFVYHGKLDYESAMWPMIHCLEGIRENVFREVFDSIYYLVWQGFPCLGSIRSEARAVYNGMPVKIDYYVYLTVPSEMGDATGHIKVDIISDVIDLPALEADIMNCIGEAEKNYEEYVCFPFKVPRRTAVISSARS